MEIILAERGLHTLTIEHITTPANEVLLLNLSENNMYPARSQFFGGIWVISLKCFDTRSLWEIAVGHGKLSFESFDGTAREILNGQYL